MDFSQAGTVPSEPSGVVGTGGPFSGKEFPGKNFIRSAVSRIVSGVSEQAQGMSLITDDAAQKNLLDQLKKYQIAQFLFKVERRDKKSRYGNLTQLYRKGGARGLIGSELFNAWDGNGNPTPIDGYLLSIIEEDEQGKPLNRRRNGLSAYPMIRGKVGSPVVLVLIEEKISDKKGKRQAQDQNANFYQSKYGSIKEPVRRWPTSRELKMKFNIVGD